MAQIVDHRHCEVCGDVVDVGKRWCSQECIDKHDEAQKLKKRQALLIVLMVLFVLIMPYVVENFR